MARSGRTSPVEDLIGIAARLPWWACLVLAVVSYLLLHGLASKPLTVGTDPTQLRDLVLGTYFRGLATFGQYALPAVFVLGAVWSAAARHASRTLATKVTKNGAVDALNDMTWQQFEQLVGEGFRLQGYAVLETGGGGADGGVDLVLKRDAEKYLVQCKQWKAHKVGVDVIRQLYGVMAASGAAGGFVVTSGSFTDEAIRFASGRNVKLIDGPKLLGLLKQAQAAQPGPRGNEAVVPPPAPRPTASAPSCRLCARPMTRRLARRGSNAGHEFWGCTGFPTCKGSEPIR